MAVLRPGLMLALTFGALAGGCGHASPATVGSAPAPALRPGAGAPTTLPDPAPTGIAADAASVAVIRGWSDALRRGDVRRAAAYFALPSVMVNGPDANGLATVLSINTEAQALAANVSLPCGATLAGTDRRGSYVNALFSLGARSGPGGDCHGQRGVARVNFIISRGRIVHWLRAPSDPGDRSPGPPSGPGPGPAAPSASPPV